MRAEATPPAEPPPLPPPPPRGHGIIITVTAAVVRCPRWGGGSPALRPDISPLRPRFAWGTGAGNESFLMPVGRCHLEAGCAVRVPLHRDSVTSPCGEQRCVHSLAYSAGCPAPTPPVTHSLLVSAHIPSWPRFPSLPLPPPTGASSLRVFPDQLFLLESRASSLGTALAPC